MSLTAEQEELETKAERYLQIRTPIRKRTLWNIFLLLMGAALIYLTFWGPKDLAKNYQENFSIWIALGIVLAAWLCEYFDSALGMGYGTTLTPLLMILGFPAIVIVPCILVSEMLTGIAAGIVHHELGNVDLRRGTRARASMFVLAACSVLGTIAAVFLAVKLSKFALNTAIGIVIISVGAFLLIRRKEIMFSWRRIVVLGLAAAFNKGLSGGGYGPLVTGGQILCGVPEKNAVGITSLAEGITCFVGLIIYVWQKGWPDWHLMVPMTVGALLSVPLAAYTVRLMPPTLLKGTIAKVTIFLGLLTLLKTFLGISGGGGGG